MIDGIYWIYIVTNQPHGTIYIGVTNNLSRRIYEHRDKRVEGFTRKYNLTQLVYYEEYSNPIDAIQREKQLKAWRRNWKIDLINEFNPDWDDLYSTLNGIPLAVSF